MSLRELEVLLEDAFNLQAFLKMGRLSAGERREFYSKLAKRSFQIAGRTYIRVHKTVKDPLFPELTTTTGSGKDPFRPRAKIWGNEEETKTKTEDRKCVISQWEDPRLDDAIFSRLAKISGMGERLTDSWILGQSCYINAGRFYVSLQLSYYSSESPYLIFGISNPFKALGSQRFFISNKTQMVAFLPLTPTQTRTCYSDSSIRTGRTRGKGTWTQSCPRTSARRSASGGHDLTGSSNRRVRSPYHWSGTSLRRESPKPPRCTLCCFLPLWTRVGPPIVSITYIFPATSK